MDTPLTTRLKDWWSTPVARALLALLLMVAIGCLFNAEGAFFRWSVHRDMLRQVSVFGILACGMTVVIITAGIDLSVSSVLALAAVLFAWLLLPLGWPAFLAIPVVLVAGTALGSVSGLLVARMRIQPFIVTLAMMVFARGLAKVVSGGRKITNYVQEPDGSSRVVDLPQVFDLIDSRVLGGNLSIVTIIFLVCVAMTWVVLSRLRLGRHIFAVGGNEEAARLSGVRCAAPSWRHTPSRASSRPWPASARRPRRPTETRKPGRPTSWTPSPWWSSAEPRWPEEKGAWS